MDFDLSVKKLEKETQNRRDLAKQKLLKEKSLQEQQKQREALLLEQAKLKKIDDERIADEKLANELCEYAETDGIKFSLSKLIPYEIDGNDDKVILPESALHELSSLDVYSKGPMYFKLSAKVINKQNNEIKDIITHIGVREFTAQPQSIRLPKKVYDTLLADSIDGSITDLGIKYVRLPKISYVKLQPKNNDFFSVGPIKMCLEENLSTHSTLSLNDVVTVWYRGKCHSLKVVEIKPNQYGSLINADVEVDLDLSEEFIKHQNELESTRTESKRTLSEENSNTNLDSIITQQQTSISGKETNSLLSNVSYPIIPEPDLSQTNVITLKIRTSNHGTITRRFDYKTSFKNVFYLVAQHLQQQVEHIQLSTRFPSRVFVSDSIGEETFESIGMTSPQELLMVTVV